MEGLWQPYWTQTLLLDAIKPDLGSFSNRLASGRLDAASGPPDAPDPEALNDSVVSNSKFHRWLEIEGRGHDLPSTVTSTVGTRSCRDVECGYVKGGIGYTMELHVVSEDGRHRHAERWLYWGFRSIGTMNKFPVFV